MATTKSTSKKTTNKKTDLQKKTPVKKSSTIKSSSISKKSTPTVTTKKSRKASSKPQKMESFKPYKDKQNFMEFKITQQTVYWAIIGVIVLGFGLWIFKVQSEVYAIYDQIDANIREESALDQRLIELKQDEVVQ